MVCRQDYAPWMNYGRRKRRRTMPFKSKAQERAAFSGALGSKMKKAAPEWAKQTNQKALPARKATKKK